MKYLDAAQVALDLVEEHTPRREKTVLFQEPGSYSDNLKYFQETKENIREGYKHIGYYKLQRLHMHIKHYGDAHSRLLLYPPVRALLSACAELNS